MIKLLKQIRQNLNQRPKLWCSLTGAITAAALPPHYFWPALFLGFSHLLWQLNNALSGKKAFAYGYWFGFGFFATGLSWVGNALLIDAMSFGWLYPLVLLSAGGFFGLFTAVPAALSFYFRAGYARSGFLGGNAVESIGSQKGCLAGILRNGNRLLQTRTW